MPVDPVEIKLVVELEASDLRRALQGITMNVQGVAQAVRTEEIQRIATEIRETFRAQTEAARTIKRAGEAVQRSVDPLARLLENLERGGLGDLGKLAVAVASVYREEAIGRPFMSLERTTRVAELLSRGPIEEYLVSVGAARARWGFWKMFLEAAKGFFKLGFENLQDELSRVKRLAESRGIAYDPRKAIVAAMNRWNVKLMFELGKLMLLFVGLKTAVEMLVERAAQISGGMGVVLSLLRSIMTMFLKPLYDAVAFTILPVMMALLGVSIAFYKNIGVPLVKASIGAMRGLESVRRRLNDIFPHLGDIVVLLSSILATLATIKAVGAIRGAVSALSARAIAAALGGAGRSIIPAGLLPAPGTAAAGAAAVLAGLAAGGWLGERLAGGPERMYAAIARLRAVSEAEGRGLAYWFAEASRAAMDYAMSMRRAGGIIRMVVSYLAEALSIVAWLLGRASLGAGRLGERAEAAGREAWASLNMRVNLVLDATGAVVGKIEDVFREVLG